MNYQNLNIIIIDDMTYISSLLMDHLKLIGCDPNCIFKANSVDGAVKLIKTNHKTVRKINLIITDLNMPDKTGIDLIKTVRVTPEYKDVPIIVVTVQENSASIIKAMEAGANSYLFKPWGADDLKKNLDSALQMMKSEI